MMRQVSSRWKLADVKMELVDWPMWHRSRWSGIGAVGLCQKKMLCRVQVLCELFVIEKIVFFLVKLYGVMID
jgi:hypothetical protein